MKRLVLLYQADDLDDLTRVIERCVLEPTLREQLGHAAKDWVLNNRTWDVVVKNTLDAYEKVKK